MQERSPHGTCDMQVVSQAPVHAWIPQRYRLQQSVHVLCWPNARSAHTKGILQMSWTSRGRDRNFCCLHPWTRLYVSGTSPWTIACAFFGAHGWALGCGCQLHVSRYSCNAHSPGFVNPGCVRILLHSAATDQAMLQDVAVAHHILAGVGRIGVCIVGLSDIAAA